MIARLIHSRALPLALLPLCLGLALLIPSAGAAPHLQPNLSVNPNSGPAGSNVTVSGSGFTPGTGTLLWDGAAQSTLTIDGNGGFSVPFTIPGNASPGGHLIEVCWGNPCAGGEFEEKAGTQFNVAAATNTPSATFTPSITPTATLTLTPSITPTPSDTPTPTQTSTPTALPESGLCSGPPAGAAVVDFEGATYRGTSVSYLYGSPSSPGGIGYQVLWSEDLTVQRNFFEGARINFAEAPGGRISTVAPRSGAWTVLGVQLGVQSRLWREQTVTLRAYNAAGVAVASASTTIGPEFAPFDTCLQVAAPEIAQVRILGDETSSGRSGVDVHFDDLFFVAGEETLACEDFIRFTAPADGSNLGPTGWVLVEGEFRHTRYPAEFRLHRPGRLARTWTQDGVNYGPYARQDASDPNHYTFSWNFEVPGPGTHSLEASLGPLSCAFDDEQGRDSLTFTVEITPTPSLTPTPTATATPVHTPTVFRLDEIAFTQHGPFDVALPPDAGSPFDFGRFASALFGGDEHGFRFPSYMVAGKDSALRVRALLAGDIFGLLPVAVHPVELHITYGDGSRHVYQAHHRVGARFESGTPFGGLSEMYFLLDGNDIPAGVARFELVFHWGGSEVHRRQLGQGSFQQVPSQLQYYAFVEPPAPGDLVRYYTQITDTARIYAVPKYAAPYGSPLARDGAGIVHVLSPEVIDLPRGQSPLASVFSFLSGSPGPSYDFSWDFIQDDSDGRIILKREIGRVIDCNGDGTIDDSDRPLGWLVDEDGDGAFDAETLMERGALLGNWWQPEDANDDGVISEQELANFVRWFNDRDGDGRWYDYREPASRSRFSAGDPYLDFADSNMNCLLDDPENTSDTWTPGKRRKDNLWAFMRGQAEARMLDFAARNGLPRIVTVALISNSVKLGGLVGNCGPGGVCWAGLGTQGMTAAHEIGHFWTLSHDEPTRFAAGALNLYEWRWIEGDRAFNLMFRSVGNEPRENFLRAPRFEQLFNRGRGGWTAWAPGHGAELAGSSAGRLAVQTEAVSALFVSGALDSQDGAVLDTLYPLDARALSEPAAAGNYSVVVLDSEGLLLSELPFSAPLSEECHDCDPSDQQAVFSLRPFTLIVPFPSGAARLQVRAGEQVLLERGVSAAAPEISLGELPPDGVDRRTPLHLNWEASDPDEDELTYQLAFSNDGGSSFTTFAIGLREPSYRWDPAPYPGGEGVVLRVTASDGFHAASADFPAFALSDAPPQVAIAHPLPDDQFGSRDRLTLAATAIDLEDGSLDGAAVRWLRVGGGELGQGARLTLHRFPVGEHTVVVQASDSAGQTAEAEISFTVVDRPQRDPLRSEPLQVELQGLPADDRLPLCEGAELELELELDEAGLRSDTLRLALAPPPDAAGELQTQLLPLTRQAAGRFRLQLDVAQDAPLGEYQWAVLALGEDGVERRSEMQSLELTECGSGIEAVSRIVRPIVATVLGAAALAGAAGLYVLWRRQNDASP